MSAKHNNRYNIGEGFPSNNAKDNDKFELDDPAESPPPCYSNESDDDELRQDKKVNIRESISTQKMGNILKYLDEVESQTEAEIGSVTTIGNVSDCPSPESVRSVRSHRSTDIRTQPCYSDIKSKLVALTVELNDKTQTLDLLKQARKKDKDHFETEMKKKETECEQRLQSEGAEYEECLRKQLDRIDALIEDKSHLAKNCENLTTQLTETEKEIEKAMAEKSQQWQRKVKQIHEMYKAKKKIWREEWEEVAKKNNNKLLAKSLQEQIAQHLENQRQDLIRVRMNHEVEKKKLQDRLQKQHEEELQCQREDFEKRVEKIVDEQCQLLRDRLKEANTERIKQLSEQQERLERESERARDVLYAELKRAKGAHEEETRRLQKSHERHISDLKRSTAKERDELEAKHRINLERYKENNSVESDTWIRNTRRNLQRDLELEKEEIISKTKKKRDEEIEIIRQKLEQRYRDKAKEENRQAEARFKKQLKSYQDQLHQADDAERVVQEKYERLQQKMEEMKLDLNHELGQKQKMEDILDSYKDKQRQLKDTIETERREWETRLREKENEVQSIEKNQDEERDALVKKTQALEEELETIHEKQQKKISQLKAQHHEALENVGTRVRTTIQKKDKMIQSLQEELHLTEIKYQQTQSVLDDQRRRLLD